MRTMRCGDGSSVPWLTLARAMIAWLRAYAMKLDGHTSFVDISRCSRDRSAYARYSNWNRSCNSPVSWNCCPRRSGRVKPKRLYTSWRDRFSCASVGFSTQWCTKSASTGVPPYCENG